MKKTFVWSLLILGICLWASVAQAVDNAIINGTFHTVSGWDVEGTVAYGSGSVVNDGSGNSMFMTPTGVLVRVN